MSQVISISGLPGSGTSTVCQLLNSETGRRYLNTGEVFRKMAAESGLSLSEFGKRAEGDPEIDRELDARMIQEARKAKGDVILEGRLTGWMAGREELAAFTVWLHASMEVRSDRVGKRENQNHDAVLAAITERERSERHRYIEHHGIDIADLSIYDLVIDSSTLSPQAIVRQIMAAFLGKS